ncbi:MAG: hypothetical protein HXY50_14955 [Ignavibacteriaceae bacterium]|nr:hypothetical protein [Ignavibacteriaceae bacterium]
MFKRYLLISVLTLSLIPMSFAQKTDKMEKTGGYARILGMGNNPYIVDPFYVTVNPAWGAYYDHFVFGDLGSTAGAFAAGGVGQFASFNFRVNSDLTLGALLSRNDFNGFGIARLDPFGIVAQVPQTIALNNNLELLATLNLGNTVVGLGVAYASTSREQDPAGSTDKTTASASQIGINLGLISKLASNMKLDLAASLMLPGASFEPPSPGLTIEGSNTVINVAGRLFWDYSSKLAIVPTVNFILGSGSIDVPSTATSTKTEDLPSTMVLVAGLGINYKVGDFLLAGGPAFAMTKVSQDSNSLGNESSTSNTIFPLWNLGIEWKMNDWFVARLGYIASTGSQSSETTVGGETGESSQTIFVPAPGATVGIGFRLGSFSLDATVNEDVLRQGLANIGGNGPTLAYLSASYALP